MNPRRRNRKIAATAKYSVPLDEEQSAKAGGFDRKGRVKKGYKVVGGEITSGRIPFETVATPSKFKRRRRAVGQISAAGKGRTKIY